MPVTITQPEFMRRMADMQKLSGQNPMMGMGGFEMYNLGWNANHPKVGEILRKGENKDKKPSSFATLRY